MDVRNGHIVLDFDDTTEESVYFVGVLPSNYSGNGITAVLTWAATSDDDSMHQAGWGVSAERHPVGFDLDTDDFTPTGQAYIWLPTEPGEIKRTAMSLSDTSSFVAGESFRLRVQRMATDDSAEGDVELLVVELRES